MTISFNGANFVARQLDWRMTLGREQGDTAAQYWFRSADTFRERFGDMLDRVVELGFGSFELWTAQLHWSWATEDHLAAAREALTERNLTLAGYTGHFGDTEAEFRKAVRVVTSLGGRILGGSTGLISRDPGGLVSVLRESDAVFGYGNQSGEKSPEDVLGRLGGLPADVAGVCLDTGWFGTQGFDAREAVRRLRDRLVHIHLKDVRAAGAHNTCAYGEGVVPVEGVVRYLTDIGWAGGVSVVHQPADRDPSEEVRASRILLESWLAD